jgi:MOSC domain-containing protein YiiM
MKIISLNTGMPKETSFKQKVYRTGIDKRPTQKVLLSKHGFAGDGVANTDFHGGPDRAVCFYAYEHYMEWEQEFNQSFPIPSFGENLTVIGMSEKNICIGDIIQIGDAVVQITQGRIPCSTISQHNHIDLLLKRIINTCHTGYFARVLKEGYIQQDSQMMIVNRHPLEVDVHFTIETFFHQPEKNRIEQILKVTELAEVMRDKFTKKLLKLQNP